LIDHGTKAISPRWHREKNQRMPGACSLAQRFERGESRRIAPGERGTQCCGLQSAQVPLSVLTIELRCTRGRAPLPTAVATSSSLLRPACVHADCAARSNNTDPPRSTEGRKPRLGTGPCSQTMARPVCQARGAAEIDDELVRRAARPIAPPASWPGRRPDHRQT